MRGGKSRWVFFFAERGTPCGHSPKDLLDMAVTWVSFSSVPVRGGLKGKPKGVPKGDQRDGGLAPVVKVGLDRCF